MKKSEGKGFLKGTVVGAVVGGIAALLFAPKSGKETQADLKRKAQSVKHDLDSLVDDLVRDLTGRIDDLKDVAKDLKGEALEESRSLMSRAEVLKKDLQASATRLARSGGAAKDATVSDAKRLVDDGSAVLSELERLTKKMVASAKGRVKRSNGRA